MRLSKAVVTVILINTAINVVRSARILAIIPTPAYSHQVAFQPLWRELSKKHEVVTLTTQPIKDVNSSNLIQINLNSMIHKYINMESFDEEMIQIQNKPLKMVEFVLKIEKLTVDRLLAHPYLDNIIKNPDSEHFDIVIVEGIYPPLYAIAELLHCPVAGALSLDAMLYQHVNMGNPTHLLVYPDSMLPIFGEFTFKDRIIAAIYWLYMEYSRSYQFVPVLNQLLEEHFNTTRSIEELERNVDLFLINTNPILHGNRPLGPRTVSFGGGSHIAPKKPLPKDIDEFLTSASEGAIYFSLGSTVKGKLINYSVRRTILETFRELPYKILWKFEADQLEDKPDNVKIVKWLPQQDVLRHPNVKLFITQGGLQSVEESMYSYVPMVFLPFMGDQLSNALRVVSKGMGQYLDPETLTKEIFKKTIIEVLENDKYRKAVKKWVEIAKDQPMTGVERAVWWIDYVIRHNGTQHLSYEGRDLPTYQYYFLDVIGFFLLILIGIMILTVLILKKICKFFVKPKLEKSKLN